MTETMRREGHKALVHTAAASNLGQMLNRICRADGIGLVNIVRKPEQEALLREQGAVHVVSTASPAFVEELTQALVATGATLAFDATATVRTIRGPGEDGWLIGRRIPGPRQTQRRSTSEPPCGCDATFVTSQPAAGSPSAPASETAGDDSGASPRRPRG